MPSVPSTPVPTPMAIVSVAIDQTSRSSRSGAGSQAVQCNIDVETGANVKGLL